MDVFLRYFLSGLISIPRVDPVGSKDVVFCIALVFGVAIRYRAHRVLF